MMQGKLIVLEGIDGSGKSTQYEKLCERFEAEGKEFVKISFPRYDKDSSVLIREYLNGDYGSDPSDVNCYAASTFFAVDRFASFKTHWGEYYNNGGIILAARYTTSNDCHQGSKLPEEERRKFYDWLYDFEFNKLGLPAPDLVLYLDIDIETSLRQMENRREQTNTTADIHEKNSTYLQASLEAGHAAVEHYGWKKICCVNGGEMRSIEEIHEDIYKAVMEVL